LNLVLTPEIIEYITRLAEREDRSLSAQARQMFLFYIKANPEKSPEELPAR